MADFVGFASEIPMSIKIAWMLWMAWSIVQAAWFRRARVAAPVYQALPPRRRVPQERAAASPYDVPKPPASVRESEAPPEPGAVMEMPPVADEPFRRG